MPNLRLCRETDPIVEPPAPLPFNSASSWRNTDRTPSENTMDSIELANRALADAESKMNELKEIIDEEVESYSFAQWSQDPDDDGPYAA